MFYVCCRWVKELINWGGRVELNKGLGEVSELKTEVSIKAEYGLLLKLSAFRSHNH